jgi:hypothetical protein
MCRNCSAPLTEGTRYCPNCGQSVKQFTQPWYEAARDLLRELLDFDGRMFVTLRRLLTNPGFLSREFIEGRRVSYTSPVRLYLIVSLSFFFVLPLILRLFPVSEWSHDVPVDRYSQAMFLLLPMFALILKMFYRRFFYMAHLVFAMHLFSTMFLVFAALLSVESATERSLIALIFQAFLAVYILSYFVIALRVTYQEGWVKSTVKFFGLFLIFLPMVAGIIELAAHIPFTST